MRIFLDPKYIQNFKKIIKKNPQVLPLIKKQVSILKLNPSHPSLRLHKLKAKNPGVWSISVDEDLRILFVYTEEGALFVNIGTHDEVY